MMKQMRITKRCHILNNPLAAKSLFNDKIVIIMCVFFYFTSLTNILIPIKADIRSGVPTISARPLFASTLNISETTITPTKTSACILRFVGIFQRIEIQNRRFYTW